MFNFSGLLNRKFKKINGKVKFSGLRQIPLNIYSKNTSLLISNGYGLLSSYQIEAARRSIRKSLGKSKKIEINTCIFPYQSLTGKPSEVRMGRGKGSRIRKWVCFVKPGKILFEIKSVTNRAGIFSLKRAAEKFSLSSKIFRCFILKSKFF